MFWVNNYAAGVSLNDISDAFAAAQEFIDRYGSVTNEEFVRQMYINVYGRQPDSGGLAYWTSMLDSETLTRGQVMVEFSSAEEYLSISANQVYVTMTYMGLLRRAPDQGGFDFWVESMDLGVSGLGLIDNFLASEEYARRFTVNIDNDNQPLICSTDSDCSTEYFCQKVPGNCGGTGTCMTMPAMPTNCITLWDPVCGCDDQTYGNSCEVFIRGINVSYDGVCVP